MNIADLGLPVDVPSTALFTDQYELTMLQAALQAGTADRRSRLRGLHPAAARGPPLRRRGGHRPGAGRGRELPLRRRACSASCASSGSSTSRPCEWLAALPLQRRHLGLPGGRGVLPRLADPAGRGHLRRVRAAGDRDPLDPQPRLGDRRGRLPDGLGRRRPPADRDGRPAHPRAGRGGRVPRRVRRRLRLHLRPGGRASATASPPSAPARTPSPCCTTASATPSRPRSTRSAGARRCSSTPTTSPRPSVRAVEIAGPELGAVRIDSGDLLLVAHRVRQQLDELGATNTRIVVTSRPGRVRDRLAGGGAGGRVRRRHPAGHRQRPPDLLDGLQAGRPRRVRRPGRRRCVPVAKKSMGGKTSRRRPQVGRAAAGRGRGRRGRGDRHRAGARPSWPTGSCWWSWSRAARSSPASRWTPPATGTRRRCAGLPLSATQLSRGEPVIPTEYV